MTTETVEQNQGNDNSEQKEALALKVPDSSSLFYGNRPIEPRHLQIVNTYNSVGSNRPVSKTPLDITSTLTISGNRPVTSSHLDISKDYQIMGNRPVASNAIDDPTTLMGFLD